MQYKTEIESVPAIEWTQIKNPDNETYETVLMHENGPRGQISARVTKFENGWQICVAGIYWHYAPTFGDACSFVVQVAPWLVATVASLDTLSNKTLSVGQ